jgi:hypothetical protein
VYIRGLGSEEYGDQKSQENIEVTKESKLTPEMFNARDLQW